LAYIEDEFLNLLQVPELMILNEAIYLQEQGEL